MSFRFPISRTVTVRFSDTDAMGHCNNAKYFSFMEEGRAEFFAQMFPDFDPMKAFDMFPFILADIQGSFKLPTFCGQNLKVNLGVTEVGKKSFVMEYDIFESKTKTLVATGKSVLVMYDYKKESTYPIPEDLKDRLMQLSQH